METKIKNIFLAFVVALAMSVAGIALVSPQQESVRAESELTVAFYNYDAKIIGEDQLIVSGQYATAPETDPTKPATAEYTYSFSGWTVGPTGTETVAVASYPITVNTDFYALYTQVPLEYTITFNTNGGSDVTAITQDYNTEVTAPAAPTKTGYTFSGWFSDVALETAYTFTTMPAEDITVYAKFTAIPYTITFNTNGGSDVTAITQDYNTEVTAPAAPTKTGYTFSGWFSDDALETAYTFTTMPAEDITVYAKFTAIPYTITFNTNGGSDVTAITQDYNTEVTAPAAPTKTGYTFSGWFSDVALETAYTFTTMPAEDITVYAKFTAIPYTITFNTNGGSDVTAITQDYNTEVTAPAAPTKTGYTFSGWFSDDALETAYTFTTMPAEDITVYAKFTAIPYTITFNTNGGSDVTAITQDYNTEVTAPAAPTKTGYTFSGWFSDVALETAYTFTTMPAESITLYAGYTVNQYTYTFYDEDGTTVLGTAEVAYGTIITAPETTPTKAATAQYTYTFASYTGFTVGMTISADTTFKATYTETVNQYTYTFYDEDGTKVLGTAEVAYGTIITAPETTPTKAATAQYTYTFASYTGFTVGMTISADTTFKATYTETVNQYTYTFYDEDGTKVLGTAEVAYGTIITAPETTPTKAATAQYTYTFASYTGFTVGMTISADTTFKATYTETVNQYTYTFYDEDGTKVLGTAEVAYGTIITAPETTPTKAATAQYTYTFASYTGFTVGMTISADTTFKATYTETVNQYTYTFYDEDGTKVLGTAEVAYGTIITAPETTPTKAATAQYTYTFASYTGFTVGMTISADTTFKATYTETVNQYTYTFYDEDGTKVLGTAEVAYGTIITAPETTPTKAATAQYTYTFASYTGFTVGMTISADTTFKATYTETVNQYTYTFYDEDGTKVLGTAEVAYGTIITAPETTPTKAATAQYTYTFASYTGFTVGMTISADTTFKATYTETVNQYTYTFYDEDGTKVLGTAEVAYGTIITAPETTPTKAATAQYTYTFASYTGFTVGMTISADTTFKATYTETVNQYTYTFYDEDGTKVLGTAEVAYGTIITAPETTPTKAATAQYTYTFASYTGFTVGMTISADTTFKATYTETVNQYTYTFYDEDGTKVLGTAEVAYGTIITAPETTPTKAATAQYTYTFASYTGFTVGMTISADTTFKATYTETVNQYTYTFYDEDGTKVLGTAEVAYGTIITAPETTPTKAATAQYTYTFASYTGFTVGMTISADTTFKATYTETVNQYTYTFYDEDGTKVLGTAEVAYGTIITAPETTPTKAATAQYTYTFASYTGFTVGMTISADTTFKATYTETVNQYTYTFYDEDGTKVLGTAEVAYGTIITAPETTPTKAATAQYTYTFASYTGFTVGMTISADTTFKATYTETVNQYTYTFYDEDGTKVLGTAEVAYGTIITAPETTPTKAATAQYTYTFASYTGFTVGMTISADTTFKATYTETVNQYTYTFYDEDGTKVLGTAEVAYGTIITAPETTPTKAATAQYTYTFASYTGFTVGMTISADTTFKATYTETVNQYTYTFYDEDGTKVLGTAEVAYGTIITAPETTPTKAATAQYTYTFASYTGFTVGMTISADTTFKATYTETVNQYTYTFYDEDGTKVLGTAEVAYGTIITAPETTPTKAATAQYTYTFASYTGFTVGMTISADTTFKATYTETVNQYTYTFYDEDGTTVLGTAEVAYGTIITAPETTPTKAATAQYTYTFASYTGFTAGMTIAEDVTFTATYTETPVSYTITYTLNEGTVETANPTTYTVETATITLNNPTRTGYTFGGWFADADFTGTAITTIALGSTGNLVLFAEWELVFSEDGLSTIVVDEEATEIELDTAFITEDTETIDVQFDNVKISFDDTTLAQMLALNERNISINATEVEVADLETTQTIKDKLANFSVYSFNITIGDTAFTTFDGLVTITLAYTLAEGLTEDNIVIYYLDSVDGLVKVTGDITYNATEQTVTFTTAHFSEFAVGTEVGISTLVIISAAILVIIIICGMIILVRKRSKFKEF